jgi:hypothetical protein
LISGNTSELPCHTLLAIWSLGITAGHTPLASYNVMPLSWE